VISETCKVVLACTDRNQHRELTLRTFEFDRQTPPGEAAKWVPAVAGQHLPLSCPRCGRELRLGRATGGRLLAELEWRARAEGRARLDVSLLPF
jgi:hypothetical protein